MAKETNIEWCDSTHNLQMGCDGCELWNPKIGVKKCYAGVLTERYAPNAKGRGWPESFDKPKVFLERLKPMLDWTDLTGTERPNKPWLNGYPRTIFLDDMGDTFTESLPLDWLAPAIPEMEKSPHVHIMLTKRVKRMKAFFELIGYVPQNFWLMTTVTSASTLGRVADLLSIEGATVYGASCEPLWGEIDLRPYLAWYEVVRKHGSTGEITGRRRHGLNWIIGGFESGSNAQPGHPNWATSLRDDCVLASVPFFWKQWGEYRPYEAMDHIFCKSAAQYFVSPDGKTATHREGVKWPDRYGEDAGWSLMTKCGKKKAGRLLDGREWNQMPKVAEAA